MPEGYYPTGSEQIRSFIAIELPEEIKDGLASLQAELKLAGYTFIKWVDPEGIHLTLKFLGNILATKVPDIVRAIERAILESSPFQLEFSGLGAFPNLKKPEVLWVGVGGEIEKLINLHQLIDKALIPQGFSPEARPFTPHLTLARLRSSASPKERQSFGELVKKTPFTVKYIVKVNNVSLMRSQLFPTGAVYSRLAQIPLKTVN